MIATRLKVWNMVLCKSLWYFIYGEYGVLLEVSCWLTW
jgi:hypothetical protein